MGTIKEAKYLNNFISIKDYDDKTHYQKIFCPECLKAPIHIVRKQNAKPYFASNRKDEHDQDCQHYEEFVKTDKLTQLIESDKEEDQERIRFLIRSNINAALRLLLKDRESKISNDISFKTCNSKLPNTVANPHNFRRESINRVSIRNLRDKDDLLDTFIVVYGICNLEVMLHKFSDKNTKEKYAVKQLIFRLNNKFVFSIMLSKGQTPHFNPNVGKYSVAFAVFGKLFFNKSFLNLRVETTKHLEIIFE